MLANFCFAVASISKKKLHEVKTEDVPLVGNLLIKTVCYGSGSRLADCAKDWGKIDEAVVDAVERDESCKSHSGTERKRGSGDHCVRS